MWLKSIVNNNIVGSPPIVGRQLCIGSAAAGIIAAGISAAGSIGSSALSGVSASNLNGRNRAWQESMFKKQLNATWEQIHYNDIKNQVSRYKEAGISPGLALGNMQSGSISSDVPNAGTAPYQHAPDYSIAAHGLANAASQYFQFRNMEQDTRGKEIANDFAVQKQVYDVALLKQSLENLRADKVTKDLGNEFTKRTMESAVLRQDLQNKSLQAGIDYTNAQRELVVVNTAAAKYDLDFMKPQQLALLKNQIAVGRAQIAELNSRVNLNNANAAKSRADISLIAQQIQTEFYRTANEDWDQQQKGLIYKFTKETIESDIMAKNVANTREWKQNADYSGDGVGHWFNRTLDNLTGTAGKVMSGSFKVNR